MIRKLSGSLLVALTGAAFLIGCGGSGSTSSSQGAQATQSTTATQGQSTTATQGTKGKAVESTPTTSSEPATSAVQTAVAACEQRIQNLPSAVPAYAKTSLEGVCAKDGHRGYAAIEKGLVNLCLDAVFNIPLRAIKEAEKRLLIAMCKQPG